MVLVSEKYYVQCELHKMIDEDRCKTDVAWIPEKYAKIGKVIKLKIDGVWEDGWKVVFLGAKSPAKEVEDKSRDYLKQRESSDV